MVGYNIQQTAFRGQQVLLWVTFAVLDDRQNQFTPWRKFFYILLLFALKQIVFVLKFAIDFTELWINWLLTLQNLFFFILIFKIIN